MAQKKLKRFRELGTFSNVMQYPENAAGNWKVHFGNDHPVDLELACGRGEYTVGLASIYPNKNFIGVDIKGNRMWVGAKKALENKLTNAAFLRTQIDKISAYFTVGEVNDIWITFPDPQLRGSKAKKRLTHPKFLRLYKQILSPQGTIHLKTDSPDLYHFTKLVAGIYKLKVITDYTDLYGNNSLPPELSIKTHYERLNIANSNSIFYLAFTLPVIMEENDDQLHDLLKLEMIAE